MTSTFSVASVPDLQVPLSYSLSSLSLCVLHAAALLQCFTLSEPDTDQRRFKGFADVAHSLSPLHGGGEGQVALCLRNEWGSRRAERLSDLYKSHKGQGLCVKGLCLQTFSPGLCLPSPLSLQAALNGGGWGVGGKSSVSAFQMER